MDRQSRSGSTGSEARERVRRAIIDSLTSDGAPEEMLASVLAILTSEIVDSAAVDLVQDDGSLERALTRHVNSEKEKFLIRQRSANPLSMTSSYGYPRVIKTGKSQFVPGVSEHIAERLFPGADLAVEGFTIRCYVCVPLVARSHILGALTLLTMENARSFDGNDLLFFEEIAKLMAEALEEKLRASPGRREG